MDLDSLLSQEKAPEKITLSPEDLERFFYKYKGLEKELEREEAFWRSTKKNLEAAYKKLHDEVEQRRKIEEELRRKNSEVEKMNRFMTDRELKMVELKKKIALLEGEIG